MGGDVGVLVAGFADGNLYLLHCGSNYRTTGASTIVVGRDLRSFDRTFERLLPK